MVDSGTELLSASDAGPDRCDSGDEDVVATVLLGVVRAAVAAHAPVAREVRADTLRAGRIHRTVVEGEVGRHEVRIAGRADRQLRRERICIQANSRVGKIIRLVFKSNHGRA